MASPTEHWRRRMLHKASTRGLPLLLAVLAILIPITTSNATELALLPEKAKFSLKGNGESKLVTLSKKEFKCTGVTGSGEAVSERLGTLTFKYTGCTGPLGVSCTGLSDTSGSITVS